MILPVLWRYLSLLDVEFHCADNTVVSHSSLPVPICSRRADTELFAPFTSSLSVISDRTKTIGLSVRDRAKTNIEIDASH